MISVVDLKSGQGYQPAFTYMLIIKLLKDPSYLALKSGILPGLHEDTIKRRVTYTYGVIDDSSFQEGMYPDRFMFSDMLTWPQYHEQN